MAVGWTCANQEAFMPGKLEFDFFISLFLLQFISLACHQERFVLLILPVCAKCWCPLVLSAATAPEYRDLPGSSSPWLNPSG